MVFRRRRNEAIVPSDLTLVGSEFHTISAATEKARVPAFVLTGLLLIESSCLEFLCGVCIELNLDMLVV